MGADKDKKDKGEASPAKEYGEKLVRIDLVFSQALEEDFVEQFELNRIERYTIVPIVKGKGYSQPKLGTAVWPQLNTMIMTMCSEDDAKKVKRVVSFLRNKYKTEGIACFVGTAEEF